MPGLHPAGCTSAVPDDPGRLFAHQLPRETNVSPPLAPSESPDHSSSRPGQNSALRLMAGLPTTIPKCVDPYLHFTLIHKSGRIAPPMIYLRPLPPKWREKLCPSHWSPCWAIPLSGGKFYLTRLSTCLGVPWPRCWTGMKEAEEKRKGV